MRATRDSGRNAIFSRTPLQVGFNLWHLWMILRLLGGHVDQPIGVLLIGYGGIGRLHALVYRTLSILYPQLPPVRLIGVVTATERGAARARAELDGVAVTTDLAAALGWPAVTLVDCCAPTGEHAALGRAALLAGKHLYCEKPLTATAAASADLAALAAERGLTGGVHYHFRSIPAIQEAQRRIAAGLLGDVLGFSARYYRASHVSPQRPFSWRMAGPGSGVLVDLGAHLIDLTHFLLGPIAHVTARTRVLVPERPLPGGGTAQVTADDDAHLSVTLASGAFGSLIASKGVPGAADDLRVEAYGRSGSLIFDSRQPDALWLAEGPDAPVGGRTIFPLSRSTPPAALPGPETPSATLQWHTAALVGFLIALANGTSPPVSLAAGLHTDQIIEAALASAQPG